MRNRLLGGIVVVALAGTAGPAWAHHSFAAEYDAQKPISVTGTVTRVEWTNPHARFYVDVKDSSGAVNNWEFELGSPNQLIRRGWGRQSLKPGDTVSVEGFAARRDPHIANAKTVTLADGKRIFAASSAENQAQ